MNIKKGLLGITVGLLGVGALAVGIDATAKTSKTIAKTDAAQTVVDFTTATITRRIYFVNNDNYHGSHGGPWYNGTQLYVWAWYGDNNPGSLVASTEIYHDFYTGGLHYADVTFKGAGAAISVMFSSQSTWGGEGTKTNTCTLPSLSSKTADVIWIDNAYLNASWTPSVESCPASIGTVKSVFDKISTCTDNAFNNGYNAYPQLKANFVDACKDIADAETTPIGDKDKEGHDGYTLKNKIDKLEALYNENGWKVA